MCEIWNPIWIGINMEIEIRMRIGIKTPIQNNGIWDLLHCCSFQE
jgi:hypothetical protein